MTAGDGASSYVDLTREEQSLNLLLVIESAIPDDVPGWRTRNTERIVGSVMATFDLLPRNEREWVRL